MSALPQNLNRLRQKRKLTLKELADKLSVTEETFISWENGEAEPNVGMLVIIADALDTDLDTLVYEATPAVRKKTIKHLLLDGVIALLVGVLYLFLAPIAEEQRTLYYNATLLFFLRLLLLPAFWLIFSWAFMQSLHVLGAARPFRFKSSRPIHIAALTLVLLYVVVISPFLVDNICIAIQWLKYYQNPSLFPDGISYVSKIPRFVSEIEWAVIGTVSKQPGLFIIPGVLFWVSKPVKRQSHT